MMSEYGMAAEQAAIVVFEKHPWWTPALQRQFHEHDVAVRMATTARRAIEMLETAAHAVMILSLDDAPGECLQLLSLLPDTPQRPPTVVIASDSMFDLECPIRELGAGNVVTRRLTGEELARICHRQGVGTQAE